MIKRLFIYLTLLLILLGKGLLAQEVHNCGYNEQCYYQALERSMEEDPAKVLYLKITNAALTKLPVKVLEFKNLRALYIEGTKIKDLSTAIKCFKQLEALTLKNVPLIELPEISSLRKLKYLEIHGAWAIDATYLKCLKKLEVIEWNNATWESLPEAFLTLKKLRKLCLKEGQLRELSIPVKTWKQLEILDLSYNKLVRLPATIEQVDNLQQLLLNNNQLTVLPDACTRLKGLTRLNAANNQLETLPLSFLGLTGWIETDFSNNKLTDFPRIYTDTSLAGPNVHFLEKSLNIKGNNFSKDTKAAIRDYFIPIGEKAKLLLD